MPTIMQPTTRFTGQISQPPRQNTCRPAQLNFTNFLVKGTDVSGQLLIVDSPLVTMWYTGPWKRSLWTR